MNNPQLNELLPVNKAPWDALFVGNVIPICFKSKQQNKFKKEE